MWYYNTLQVYGDRWYDRTSCWFKSKCYSQRISLKLPFKGGDIDRGSRARNAPRIGTRRMPTINRLLLESPQSRTSASVDVRMCVGTALGAWFGRRLDVSLNNDKRINILKLNAESCDDISHCYMLILSSSSTVHTDRTPITWEYWYRFGDRQYWQRRSCSWCVT